MTLTSRALYVEIDDYAAAWLRNLIQRGVIADGDVYCGDMRECRPQDLARYNQVHLFAGVGVWSYGLRRAGIDDSANIWTFSEPCQPFSAAGKGLGFADERYLRPYTHHLVEQCRPAICLGEQVASNDGLSWLDVVSSDMERAGYAIGTSDTCSAGFGAPHIRQRLRICAVREDWMADALRNGAGSTAGNSDRTQGAIVRIDGHTSRAGVAVGDGCAFGQLADSDSGQRGRLANGQGREPDGASAGWQQGDRFAQSGGDVRSLADADHHGFQGGTEQALFGEGRRIEGDAPGCSGASLVGHNAPPAGATNGFWSNADWLYCRDGKWRPVEPGTFPLAHGASSRVGRLRAYGNAVDGEATTEYCRAVAHTLGL